MMECVNEITSSSTLSKKDKGHIIKMIAPFAPHLSRRVMGRTGQ